ncbi:hypothetical protein [Kocuria sp. HSID16901]|uniref:hypothetical protein n=1 Tax=Kocuria sp. HSID16901 TaxID=2419505 RepID=UPI00065FF91F|nr:hypothetical protein [Kocuria sp. HSID16901]RUQ21257.1 hypothetical protein D8M21_07680 [Kocuria sp. HSID16901]
MAFKLFRKNSDDDAQGSANESIDAAQQDDASSSSKVRALPDRPELPTTNGLPELVKLMESHRVATLQLNQHGNEMTAVMEPSEKPERKVTVDTESTWFDPVAKLYTAGQASENGPWRRAEIMISSVRDGKRSVEIEYTYPNSDEQVREGYTQVVRSTFAQGGKDAATAKPTDVERPVAAKPQASENAQSTSAAATQGQEQNEVLGTPTAQSADEGKITSSPATATVVSGSESRGSVTDAPASTPKGEAQTAPAKGAGASGTDAKAPVTEKPAVQGTPDAENDSSKGGSKAAATGAVVGGATGAAAGVAAGAAAKGTKETDATSSKGSQEVPSVVDDGQWDGESDRPETASASSVAADLPDSVPSTADQTDVSPSYSSSAQPAPQKPSTTQLAPGNLVLTEADVLQRMREAQKKLFGPEGSSRDVSTVLIRVRALGSYYDALTHVRRNGFWDQRKTFDIVPEEALHILELKSDSYQEGFGSPIAMMFRFTPGVPPQVSFSYEDEESFVKYKDRLPAQQYIEELRMFPRTGANIPEHMTDALTQWSL